MTMKSKAFIVISALCVMFALAGYVSKNSETAEKEAKEQEPRLTVQLDEDIEETRRLIKAGVDVNARDPEGRTALMIAEERGAADVVELLIKAGADVNEKDKFAWTALMHATLNNAADTARLLIEAGADVNARRNGDETALMLAEECNAVDVAALLKAAGAKE